MTDTPAPEPFPNARAAWEWAITVYQLDKSGAVFKIKPRAGTWQQIFEIVEDQLRLAGLFNLERCGVLLGHSSLPADDQAAIWDDAIRVIEPALRERGIVQ